jgi:UV DNA damage endonuclease
MKLNCDTYSAPTRLGLCCLFSREDIKFKTHTAKHLLKFSKKEGLGRLSEIILYNARSLKKAVEFCTANSIGSFRINSRILPLKTHPEVGYETDDLPNATEIITLFEEVADLAGCNDIRLTFHPDQFTLLSSVDERITKQSIQELLYHLEVAELLGVDTITLHGGGGYGDKQSALQRVKKNIVKLPISLRQKLALENDDKVYTPEDLLPLCNEMNIPFVYDVHHHRCHPDNYNESEATERALATWNREPLFHISSPKDGWQGKVIKSHHDFIDIDIDDFPNCWKQLNITVEVEAKAKEIAVLKLQSQLQSRYASLVFTATDGYNEKDCENNNEQEA